ncbi:MAG: hypothetical protein ACHQIG_09450 [Acidimicrobiia bacterium]
MSVPWDVFATPIEATKLARLGMERGRVVLRAAFFRQFGAAYGVDADAECPLHQHAAPQLDCSCGFYATADTDHLVRLGVDEPDVARLDVELAGHVIEHDHGYRAAHQHTRAVRVHGTCVRCGEPAEALHRRRFGALVPSCPACTRHPISLADASASLGAPVVFGDRPAPPSPRVRRLAFVLTQMAVPLACLLLAGALSVIWSSALPLMLVQLALLGWLIATPWTFPRLSGALHLAHGECTRLEHRWGRVVAAVVVACDFAVAVLALSRFRAY